MMTPNRIGTTPARTCLRCGGGAYAELREGCAHAWTIEEMAPAPLVEIVLAHGDRERAFLASHGGAAPHALHPTEEGARRLFAERWLWGQAIGALFAWLHRPAFTKDSVLRSAARVHAVREALGKHARDFAARHGLLFVPPSGLTVEGVYETQAEALAAIDREMERAVLGVEGESIGELAARLFDRERREGDADITHGPGVRPWERGPTTPDPRLVLLAGRTTFHYSHPCDCGSHSAFSLPEFGCAGWWACIECHAVWPAPEDPLADVPAALRGFRVRRPRCTVRRDLGPCPDCRDSLWLVSDVATERPRYRTIEARCADETCGHVHSFEVGHG